MASMSIKEWCTSIGCDFDCEFCEQAFQFFKRPCTTGEATLGCVFESPVHEEPLGFKFPRTRFDLAQATDDELRRALERVEPWPERIFLFLTKDPARAFARRGIPLPGNVLAGITLETNRDALALQAAKAPPPSQRVRDLLAVQHTPKAVAIEPVLDFDLNVMLAWVSNLRPAMVWLGYDSRKCGLPEPPLEKVRQLHWELSLQGMPVILKTVKDKNPY